MAGNVRVVLKSVFDDKGIKQAQSAFGEVGKGIGVAFAAVGATLALAGTAAVRFGLDAAKGAEEAAVAQRRLDQIAESMGLFGAQTAQVSKRLGEFAEANELIIGVDADVIKATQAKLLTFKNLGMTADEVGGAMDRATMAAVDLAAAGFGAAETNAVQLGKALQDPIKGITALGRAGVTFTEQEREKIKVLVESGDVLTAQNMILGAIETQVGGTAEATASAFTRIELATNQVKDAIGEALLPVVEDFADQLAVIVPELSDALAPAAQQVAGIIADSLLPAIEAFGDYLKSPAGIQAVKDLTTQIVNGVTGFVDFAKGIADNIDLIKNFAIFVGSAVIAINLLSTAAKLATAAQLLFNFAVTANPFVMAAAALAGLVIVIGAATAGLVAFHNEQKKQAQDATGFKGRLAELVAEQKRLKELVDAGVISYKDYKNAIDPVNKELAILQGNLMRAANFGRSLNDIKLDKFRGQLGDTRLAARDFANEQRELFNAIMGIKPKPIVIDTVIKTTKTGKSAAEIAREAADAAKEVAEKQAKAAQAAFDKVSKLIRNTQKKIADAQGDYDKAIIKANESYLASVVKIRAEYADKLDDIIATSQKRLTDAFRSAVSVDVGKFFTDAVELQKKQSEELAKGQEGLAKATAKLKQEQEDLNAVLLNPKATQTQITAARRAFAAAQADVDKLGNDVRNIRATSDPITGLIEGLRTRLQNANQLISRTAALAAEGFSQTFIEQIVSSGAETGNQMAAAILESTPETRQELKRLFAAVEATSETGMDQLAKTIFEQQGLATRELKDLYKNTNIELQQALGDAQVEFQRALETAANALGDKLRDIKADFEEDVADLKGSYGGLKGVIDSVSRSMDTMIGKADAAAKAASEAAIKAANATRAAVADITGKPVTGTDLGLGGGASAGAEGLRGFGDPTEMRRLAAIQAAGSALGQFGQGFVNMVQGQRSFLKDGQRTVVAGSNEARAAQLIAQGFVEEFAANIDRASLNLALALAEEVYGVDIGGMSTPGVVGGATFNITVNAGMGTDPITVGREIVDAIKRFERSSGQVFVGV